MQDKFKMNDIEIVQPDTYKVNIATTSTDDSDRDQALVMHNTPIASVESYSMGWRDILASDAAVIMQQVLNKPSFKLHYFDFLTATWRDAMFYATTFSTLCTSVEDGYERWEELSFNVIGVDPR